MELTGRRGINVLENCKKIHKLVCEGCHGDENEADVRENMNTWLALSIELYPISKACNDQSKQTDTKHKKLKGHIAEYLKLWFQYITYKNPIYPKLHSLICGLIFFHGKYGMLGRVNAQGFENKHFQMRLIKYLLGRIAQKGLRVQKTAQRSQVCFVEGLHEALNRLDEAKKAGTCCYLLSMFYSCVHLCIDPFFSSSLLHSFSYILSLSLSLSHACLSYKAKRKPRDKYNVTVNQTKIAEDMQVNKVCLFILCFFVILLLLLLYSICHVDKSCSYFFILFISYFSSYHNNLGKEQCTRRLFYEF